MSVDEVPEDYGIRCPKCGCRHVPYDKHAVAQTHTLGPRQSIRRRRVCRHCGHRFTTYERVVECDSADPG